MKTGLLVLIAFVAVIFRTGNSQETSEVCGVLETAGVTFTCTILNSDTNGVIEYFEVFKLENYGSYQAGDTVFVRGIIDSFPIGFDCVYPIFQSNLIFPCNNCCTEGGDVNGLGGTNILDLNYLVNFIFRNGLKSPCAGNADLNRDGNSADILDLNYIVNYIFRNGPPPVPC